MTHTTVKGTGLTPPIGSVLVSSLLVATAETLSLSLSTYGEMVVVVVEDSGIMEDICRCGLFIAAASTYARGTRGGAPLTSQNVK